MDMVTTVGSYRGGVCWRLETISPCGYALLVVGIDCGCVEEIAYALRHLVSQFKEGTTYYLLGCFSTDQPPLKLMNQLVVEPKDIKWTTRILLKLAQGRRMR